MTRSFWLAVACAALTLAAAQPAAAATFTVGLATDGAAAVPANDGVCASTLPGNPCTLRAAIQESNGTAGPDEIVVPEGTFVLTGNTQLEITAPVTVRGAGARSTAIVEDGIDATRVLTIDTPGAVTISDVRISTGRSTLDGGGIYQAKGFVTLRRMAVTDNRVTGLATKFGGGIFVFEGSLTLEDSTIHNNRIAAEGAAGGGGLYMGSNALLTATNVTVHDNLADCDDDGGCVSNGGDLVVHDGSLTNVTLAGNTVSATSAAATGGNLVIGTGGSTAIANSIVSDGRDDSPLFDNCHSFGTLTASGRNLEGNATSQCGAGFEQVDPTLGPFGDNGGPADTLVPVLGSPAIDRALGCPPPAADQRGTPRPTGAGCDIGATEAGADLAVALSPPATSRLDEGDVVGVDATVTNAGFEAAGGGALSLTLPGDAAFEGASSPGGACAGGATVTCPVAQLARGEDTTIRVTMRLGPSPAPKVQGTVGGGAPGDPNGANNSAELTLGVVPGVPVVRSFALARKRFRVKGKGKRSSAAVKRGSAFKFNLSHEAGVRITVQRRRAGRRKGKRWKRVPGAIRRADRPAGKGRIPFSGRLKRRALRPGRYRATIVASSASGKSKPRRATFRIVR